jgi:hypothetical protein
VVFLSFGAINALQVDNGIEGNILLFVTIIFYYFEAKFLKIYYSKFY